MGVDMKDASNNMDYPSHQRTYDAFIRFVKFGSAFVVLVLIGMAIFLL